MRLESFFLHYRKQASKSGLDCYWLESFNGANIVQDHAYERPDRCACFLGKLTQLQALIGPGPLSLVNRLVAGVVADKREKGNRPIAFSAYQNGCFNLYSERYGGMTLYTRYPRIFFGRVVAIMCVG